VFRCKNIVGGQKTAQRELYLGAWINGSIRQILSDAYCPGRDFGSFHPESSACSTS
jgi:hypothetical protein